MSKKEKLFISWVGTRWAVPAALAAGAIGLGIAEADKIFSIVMIVVLAFLVIVGFLGRKMEVYIDKSFNERKAKMKQRSAGLLMCPFLLQKPLK